MRTASTASTAHKSRSTGPSAVNSQMVCRAAMLRPRIRRRERREVDRRRGADRVGEAAQVAVLHVRLLVGEGKFIAANKRGLRTAWPHRGVAKVQHREVL